MKARPKAKDKKATVAEWAKDKAVTDKAAKKAHKAAIEAAREKAKTNGTAQPTKPEISKTKAARAELDAKLLKLLSEKDGATLVELAKATGNTTNSVRHKISHHKLTRKRDKERGVIFAIA